MPSPLAIVLAAGKSTRMKSALPKVLHEVCGRPMIDYVLDAARSAGVERIVAVVGHRADLVQAHLAQFADVSCALQAEQKGTGHAVMMCREQIAAHHGPVLILAGDTPLLKRDSLAALLAALDEQQAAAVIGTAVTAANQGLGRIVRDADGRFLRIVEEKDATVDEQAIQETNTGCYAFDAQHLLGSLDQIRPDNAQAEYYLTDCPRVLLRAGQRVIAAQCFDFVEALGVNTRVQLAEVARTIQQATLTRLMLAGVTIIDPQQTQVDPRAQIGADTVIEPFTVIRGAAVIGGDCRIGPHVVIDGAVQIPSGSVIAPFQVVR
jgi:bifunctional UDP-N-acetylglucosamine pyrophosphorylase/glucosamine-1-phosphate N-acetyltransferase